MARKMLSLAERVAIFNLLNSRVTVANEAEDHYYTDPNDNDGTIAGELASQGLVPGCKDHHVHTVRAGLYKGNLIRVKTKAPNRGEDVRELQERVAYLEHVVANLYKELNTLMPGDPLFMRAEQWLKRTK